MFGAKRCAYGGCDKGAQTRLSLFGPLAPSWGKKNDNLVCALIKSTIVGAIIGSPNIIKVKVDKVLVDSLRFTVIRSFRGDLRPTTSITVAKRFFAGVIHFPVTVTYRKEEAELVDSLRVPRRYLEENYQLAENCIDTFIIIGVRKAFSGYDVGHVYALLGRKAYANTPFDREYGIPYSSVENLDDSEMIQQIITVTVNQN